MRLPTNRSYLCPSKSVKTVLHLAVVSVFVCPTMSNAADVVVAPFPSLSNWTAASSVSEGFAKTRLPVDSSGWGPVFIPITSDRNYTTNTLLLADGSADFDRDQNYVFYAQNNSAFSIGLGDSTLRFLDESGKPDGFISHIRVDDKSTMTFIGSESSALQMKGQGSKAIFVHEGSLEFKTGNVWVELKNPERSASEIVQVQDGSSFKIEAAEDIVFMVDLSESHGIEYGIMNSGELDLKARKIYLGFKNVGNAMPGDQVNRVIEVNGTTTIGDDRTELIALNAGRVGLLVMGVDAFTLKTKALQIIGDGNPDSKAIKIGEEPKGKMQFDGGVGYFENVATGIALTGSSYESGELRFERLINLATQKAIDLNAGDLILSIAESGYFDKTVEAINGSSLTVIGKEFVFNEGIALNQSRVDITRTTPEDAVVSGSPLSVVAKKIKAEAGSGVELRGKVVIDSGLSSASGNALNDAERYALWNSNSEININSQAVDNSVTQIKGDIFVGGQGRINLGLADDQSWFVGTIKPAGPMDGNEVSSVALTLKNGAFWRLTQSNQLPVDLTLNGGVVRLDHDNEGNGTPLTPDNSKVLTVSDLSGDGGIFYLRTHLEDVSGDRIQVNKGAGHHQLMLASTGQEPSQDALERALVTQSEGSLEMSLANQGGHVDLGTYVYELVSRETANGVEWYLDDVSSVPENPDPDPEFNPNPELSPSATAVLALAGNGSQTTQFLYGLSDLRKRMGDVRQGAADGLYASVRGGKDKISGFASTTYKNEYGALSVGVDRKIDNQWIVGISLGAIEGDQKVDNNGYRAEGEDSTQSLKAYATRFDGEGGYIDFVTTINRFEQELSTHMLDGSRASASYDSHAFGLSTEVGKAFGLWHNGAYFFEPQFQLSYLRVIGKDFQMSNGLRVQQETADSLTGRLGFVLGKTMSETVGTDYQILLRGGVNHEFLGKSAIKVNGKRFDSTSLGTRGYYGIGFNWNPGSKVSLYGEINREHGAHYTSEINAQISMKYLF